MLQSRRQDSLQTDPNKDSGYQTNNVSFYLLIVLINGTINSVLILQVPIGVFEGGELLSR